MNANPIALQLYTVRDACEKDFVGTLQQVARMGYRAVQVGDTYGLSATELKRVLDDLGLSVCGIHVDLGPLEQDLGSAIDDAHALDCRYIICPYLPAERRLDAEGWRNCANIFEQIGGRCADVGITFCYHHHDFDFETFDGVCGFDILMENADSKYLQAEIDVYWVTYGGRDPVAYIDKYAGRCPLIHLKDMADDAKRSFVELGRGTLDFEAIIAATRAAGSHWLTVEQDTCKGSSLESARVSLEFMQSKGWA